MSQNRKKILILAMSCNQTLFIEQEKFLKEESYAKDIIDGKYEDVEFYSYSASADDKIHISKKNHRITVSCDDSLNGTFEKTQKIFNVLDSLNIEYDYIFRTNCSTWVNIQLLRHFIDGIPEEDSHFIYSSSIYSTLDSCGPDMFDFYGVGNSLIIPKFWIDIIKNADIEEYKKSVRNEFMDENMYKIDDNAIGIICNVYAEQHNIDKHSIWKGYRSVLETKSDFIENRTFHNYIAIPIRDYKSDRTVEFAVHKRLVMNLVDIDFSGKTDYDVYLSLVQKDLIYLVDFNQHFCLPLPREIALGFVNNHNNFDNKIENYYSYLKKLNLV